MDVLLKCLLLSFLWADTVVKTPKPWNVFYASTYFAVFDMARDLTNDCENGRSTGFTIP